MSKDSNMNGGTRRFPSTATEAAFLLGGIGTGNVSIGSRGDLRDWEIFNKPNKGLKIPFSFFAIHCRAPGNEGPRGIAKVLEAELQPPFTQSHGYNTGLVAGLPHLRAAELRGEYPFCEVTFQDPDLPVDVALETFTPFIPLNAEDSGLPGAYLRYTVRNTTSQPLIVSVAGSLPNVIGFTGLDLYRNVLVRAGGKNEYREQDEYRGLYYCCPEIPADSLDTGSMSLVSLNGDVTRKETWLRGGWFEGIQDFWDDFSQDGRLAAAVNSSAPGGKLASMDGHPRVGSLCATEEISPGQTKEFAFILAWHFPNRPRTWPRPSHKGLAAEPSVIRNHYATRFPDAWSVCAYLVEHKGRLEALSRGFHRALFGSTLPPAVIEALASNITVLRSPTCFRLEDGTFVSWEGCHDETGCCDGTCAHVWNYAETAAFLFPELERSMRAIQFNLETEPDGGMVFRTHRVFGLPKWGEAFPAADGQLGSLVQLYRDWKLCGDDTFLRSVWENAARALDFAFDFWDTDGDFVLESEQHNTYDIEFYGQTSFINSIFFAALKAGAEMAGHVGDATRQRKYLGALREGAMKMDALLWNGEYYVQNLPDVDAYRYQYGKGCLSDQLLGQLLAHVAGLGYILPEDHVKSAIRSVHRHNFLRGFRDYPNVQRTFALQDESGLVLCTWPRGERPRLPFVYCHEVWSGVEYQVAAHLIYEGFLEEGLEIVNAARSRYDGYRRNPWNEVECGHHYVRSLASWALLPALCGYRFDLVRGCISFQPRYSADNFSSFFSTGRAWGVYRQQVDPASGKRTWQVEVIYGSLDGVKVNDESCL